MSERVILVEGFTPLPEGWPKHFQHHSDVLLVSDGQHFVGSRPYPGGLQFRARLPSGEPCALDWRLMGVATDGVAHLAVFIMASDGLRSRDGGAFVQSHDVPAPFDRFKVGGERLPERAEA